MVTGSLCQPGECSKGSEGETQPNPWWSGRTHRAMELCQAPHRVAQSHACWCHRSERSPSPGLIESHGHGTKLRDFGEHQRLCMPTPLPGCRKHLAKLPQRVMRHRRGTVQTLMESVRTWRALGASAGGSSKGEAHRQHGTSRQLQPSAPSPAGTTTLGKDPPPGWETAASAPWGQHGASHPAMAVLLAPPWGEDWGVTRGHVLPPDICP